MLEFSLNVEKCF